MLKSEDGGWCNYHHAINKNCNGLTAWNTDSPIKDMTISFLKYWNLMLAMDVRGQTKSDELQS